MPDLQRANLVTVGGRDWSWADLSAHFAESASARALSSAPAPTALVVAEAVEAFAALAGMATQQLDAMVLGRERLSGGVGELLDREGFACCEGLTGQITPAAAPGAITPGRVSLLTSGSTGTPKLVSHRWDTLFTARGLQRVPPRRWLIPYQIGTYAWYQLVTLGMFQPEQSLVVPTSDDLEVLFQEAAEHKVDSLSATPTFWRLACFRVPESLLRAVPLSTITLGGELADQAILDRLAELFPAAQITHIYASTEAGACVVVKDGKAGFPRDYLDRDVPDSPALRIQDGRLWIRSPFSASAAAGTPDGWLDSGDLVEIRGDRVYFLGRANAALINVGGNKAFPADIEAVLLTHPSVTWCRVRAVRSPLVGYLPEAEYVPASHDHLPDEAELTEFCAGRLPPYAVPRFWTALAKIPVQSTLKSAL